MLVITRGYFPAHFAPVCSSSSPGSRPDVPSVPSIPSRAASDVASCRRRSADKLRLLHWHAAWSQTSGWKNQAMPNLGEVCCYLLLWNWCYQNITINPKTAVATPIFWWITEGWPWHVINWGHFGAIFHWSTSPVAPTAWWPKMGRLRKADSGMRIGVQPQLNGFTTCCLI